MAEKSSDTRDGPPRRVPSCDVDALAIGALERFVLMNVDGRRTFAELAELTGVGEGDIGRILDKLVSLGAVQLSAGSAGAAPQASSATEAIDLDAALCAWVDARIAAPEMDHYALLEIAREADRKAIKNAYYALAAKLHTDRYFGKNLGSYKPKLEQVFSRVTSAHDVLASKQKREEYDAYLAERDRTQAYERLMAMVEGEGDLAEELRASTTTRAAIPLSSAAMPVATPARPASIPPLAADAKAAFVAPSGASTAELERQRREALARRLRGQTTGRRPNVTPAEAPAVQRPMADPRTATEAVKRMYEERKDAARRIQAQKFIDAADQAMVKEDVVVAANHLRLAVRYTEDPAVHQRYQAVNRRARDVMADAYAKQARYEEQQQRWRESALSYAKAIEGRPEDADLLHGAANTLRREGRDLHAAARYGEAAVQKNPNNVAFRVTLGHVYLDAGLHLRARKELEQALKLDPTHAKAKELLAQVKKLVS